MKTILRNAMALAMLLIAAQAAATNFTVTNTSDSGAGSLRQALLDAEANRLVANHDNVVVFNIPGAGVHTIRPTSPLPPIRDLLIDGYTQPGAHANTLASGTDAVLSIEIDGSLAGAGADGLVNQGAAPGTGAAPVTIRGLVINRFSGAGIHVTGPGHHFAGLGGDGSPGYATIQGCYIGTDASGTIARGNGIGIELGIDSRADIGERSPGFGGNTTPWPGFRNLISGNVGAGIKIDSTDPAWPAFGTVRNAYIGTDATGLAALGNGGDGVVIGPGGGIGNPAFGAFIYLYDNLIAANGGDGIDTQGTGTQASGNTIGSGVDGRPLGNQGNGAYFHGTSAGSLTALFGQQGVAGPGVANNAGAGVLIADSALVDLAGRFSGNGGLGVDIAPLGSNANDIGDADGGPNEGLNFPVITSAVASGASTRIQGTLNSKPNAQIEVRLFMNPACNASGFGDGLVLADTVVGLTTDGSGNASFDRTLSFAINRASFPYLTAQSRRFAENPGLLASVLEVSEFSACFPVAGGVAVPTLSVDDVSVSEGNAGTATATFTVTLSAAAATAVTVNYATADTTATVGSDYIASAGVLTFAAGQITKTILVPIMGDTMVEPNEAYGVNLTAPSGATLVKAQGVGTIVNDDVALPPALPTLSIDDVSITEGNSGTAAATFTVTLSAAATGAVTVTYTTADVTAMAGSDYASATGTLSFAAGQLTKTVTINVNGDVAVEPNETFGVDLSAATDATIAKVRGQGTITNDDSAPPGGGGGGGGGGGAMDPWLLAALGLFILAIKFGRGRAR